MKRKNVRRTAGGAVLFLVLATLLVASAAPVAAMPGRHHLGARLDGTSHYSYARGHAYYEERSGHREFDVDMWGMGRLGGQTLVVFAGGHKVGSLTVRSDGGCHMHRDTGSGQSVPTLSAGDPIAVRTQGGALVASGTLRRMMM